ncbi:response regulator transcription factor [Streptosporangium sp. NPDC001681]|uniref:response regulator transcription factor n=1 Tax=Streptosporangium sp. NPDC001681 TaxID=3154395 RepID=UPI00332FBD33
MGDVMGGVKTRILLVDEQEIARRGVCDIVASESDLEVVGEVRNGRDALPIAACTRPDVVITAAELPDMDGVEVVRALRGSATCSEVAVIVIADRDSDVVLVNALRAGASGFLVRNCRAGEWLNAIYAVTRGAAYLAPPTIRRLIDNFLILPLMQSPEAIPPELSDLSGRELQVVRAVGLGKSNREIARELSVSEATVKSHVSRILAKLNLRDRIQMAALTWWLGLVPLPEVACDATGLTDRVVLDQG